MGNSLNTSNLKPLNDKCPICLLELNENNNNIKLACNHQLHKDCGKHMCKDFIISDVGIYCPLCRYKLNKKEIFSFLKNNISEIYINDPVDWTRKDIININDISDYSFMNKNNTISSVYLNKIDELSDIDSVLLSPLIKRKDLDIPFYLKITNLENINIIDHEINNTDLNFEICLGAKIINTNNSYQTFLTNFVKLVLNNNSIKSTNLSLQSLKNDLNNSSENIRIVITNLENIKTFDTYEGDISDGFQYKENLRFDIIIKPVIYQKNNNIYYFNKLISILYYL